MVSRLDKSQPELDDTGAGILPYALGTLRVV